MLEKARWVLSLPEEEWTLVGATGDASWRSRRPFKVS